MYRHIIKPFFDILAAAVAIVITLPFLTFAIIMLSIANKGKIWFRQQRPGLHGRIFTVIKFKTMNDNKDLRGNLLSDEERLTTIGKLIRRTSLDELPQLFNVLSGDMSLVGPRPLLVEYLDLYSDVQKKRHAVKPGITGWAQVNGRNTITWEQKFNYDIWYVEHISFWLDLKILFLTVLKVFRGEGINSATSVTMEKFRGNK